VDGALTLGNEAAEAAAAAPAIDEAKPQSALCNVHIAAELAIALNSNTTDTDTNSNCSTELDAKLESKLASCFLFFH